jgi:ATP-dependent DNA ligase
MRRGSSSVPASGMAQPGARGSPTAGLPVWISQQLTQLVEAAPDGDQWLHEIKYDGYRMHARLQRGAAKLLTRTGLDWTHKYLAIAKAVAALDAHQAFRHVVAESPFVLCPLMRRFRAFRYFWPCCTY